jgi:threonine dehydratase
VIDHTVTVSEEEIARAMRVVAETDRWMIEGAAGVAIAGLLREAGRYSGKTVAVVLCGRNIALQTFLTVVNGAR